MAVCLYSLFLIACFATCLPLIQRRRGDYIFLLTVLALGFVVRVGFMFANEYVSFIAAKGAGDRVLQEFEFIALRGGLSGMSTFFVQALLNLPAFTLFEESRMIALTTNAFVGAFTPVLAYVYMTPLFGRKCGIYAVVLFGLYPAAIEFSILGLRDIIIYFFMSWYILALMRMFVREAVSLKDVSAVGLSVLAMFSLRAELLPIMLLFAGAPVMSRLLESFRRIRSAALRGAVIVVCGSLLLSVVLFVTAFFYKLTIGQLNIHDFVSPVEIAQKYAEIRYNRPLGESMGAGSHIVAEQTFKNMNIYARIALQTLGILVIPFPWLLTSPARFLALGDTFFVFWVLWGAIRGAQHYSRRAQSVFQGQLFYYALLAFTAGVMIMGLIVINAGNAFRMRMALLPFAFVAAAYYFSRRKGRVHEAD